MAQLRLAVLLVAATATVASADAIQPPAGWHADAKRAAEVAAAGKEDGSVIVAYMPAQADAGIALFVTTAARRGTTLDAEVADFHHNTGSGDGQSSNNNRTPDSADSRLSSRDPSTHIAREARLLAKLDGDLVRSAVGECLMRDDADRALVDACKASLDTLAIVAAVSSAGSAAGSAAPTGDPWGEAAPSVPSALPQVRAPQMFDGSQYYMPPVEVPPADPGIDRRPILFGAGLAVLALAFWWNRRSRNRAHDDRGDGHDG
jgi:hypothetical protein